MKVAIGTHLLCEEIEGILGDGGIERCLMMLGDIEDGKKHDGKEIAEYTYSLRFPVWDELVQCSRIEYIA